MTTKNVHSKQDNVSLIEGFFDTFGIKMTSHGGVIEKVGTEEGGLAFDVEAVGSTVEYNEDGFPIKRTRGDCVVEAHTDAAKRLKEQLYLDMSSGKMDFTYERININYKDISDDVDESIRKNTIFKWGGSYSYYNLQMIDYENATIGSSELSLPCYMFGWYQKQYPNELSAITYLNNDSHIEMREYAMVNSYPTNQKGNGNIYKFNWHNGYNYESNYFHNYAKHGLINNDALRPNKKNMFFSYTPSRAPNPKDLYDVPFFNCVSIPASSPIIKGFGERIKKSGYANIFLKTLRGDFINNNYRTHAVDGESVVRVYPWRLKPFGLNNTNYALFIKGNSNLSLYDPDNVEIEKDGFSDFGILDSTAILEAQMQTYIADNIKNFKELFYDRSFCKTEAVAFKIAKRKRGGMEPIQNFYFFNNENVSQFIDTQIQYGTVYEYIMTTFYAAVVYDISFRPKVERSDGFVFDMGVSPRVRIFEVTNGMVELAVVEPPPGKPIVRFSNYKNADFKIKISVGIPPTTDITPHGRKHLKMISESDTEYISKLQTYAKTEYPYTSPVAAYGMYEIYRMDVPPRTIKDFSDKLYHVIDSGELDRFSRKLKKSATIDHMLEHGKKYYYLFRCLTHRDNFSNPSVVYEVEKIKDSDETILNAKVYEMPESDDFSFNVSFRKYMKISFNERHLTMNSYDSSGNDAITAVNNNIVLGDKGLEDSVWNYNKLSKDFIKLRLESKSTGKKVDFNLIFNYQQKPEN